MRLKKKKGAWEKQTNKQKTSLDSLIQVDFGKCPSSVLSTGTSTLLCSSLKHWATTEIKHIVLIFLWFIQINTLLTFALDFFFWSAKVEWVTQPYPEIFVLCWVAKKIEWFTTTRLTQWPQYQSRLTTVLFS